MRIMIDIDIGEQWQGVYPELEQKTQAIVQEILQTKSNIEHYAEEIFLSIVLCDDQEIQEINKKHRNIDKPTNVLSFPQEEIHHGDFSEVKIFDDCLTLGDVVLSWNTIKREAMEQDKSFADHYYHLLAHGVLHLIGYDHEKDDEAELMEKIEVDILTKFDIKSPYEE
jgi:probable rRNA maturation factor